MSMRIFGYGSLIWRPDFPHLRRTPGWIEGWTRRFWQGSTDHRGLPGAPGRVVTLLEEPGARCGGVLYELDPSAAAEVLEGLDVRERGGYERHEVRMSPRDGGPPERALVYIATPDNPNYLGPASLDEIVECVLRSRGPSGPNTEYLLRLDEALARLGLPDPHVHALADRLRRRMPT